MNQWNILSPEQYKEKAIKRFFDTIEKNQDGCWIWKGYLCSPKKIYGLTSSRLDGKKKKILAHRLSYRLFNGDIPHGSCVLHTCDIPLCVNPDHLWIGSNYEYQKDMIEKGRDKKSYGETCALSRFKTEEIIEIRKMRAEGFLFREIAEKFKTSTGNISSIVQKQSWKHI
jgi:hypothetical protein